MIVLEERLKPTPPLTPKLGFTVAPAPTQTFRMLPPLSQVPFGVTSELELGLPGNAVIEPLTLGEVKDSLCPELETVGPPIPLLMLAEGKGAVTPTPTVRLTEGRGAVTSTPTGSGPTT